MKISLDLELVWESPSLLHFLFYTLKSRRKVLALSIFRHISVLTKTIFVSLLLFISFSMLLVPTRRSCYVEKAVSS